MVIDAGSGGSRLHVFRWAPRVFKSIPPGVTVPTSDEKWTGRMSPGISDLVGQPDLISNHLLKLISFAKVALAGSEKHFGDYPIFFKATGGMRQVPLEPREEIMNTVRSILSNKTLCPFYFRRDMARVISGEEEAIYSWTAVNFLMGTLFPKSIGTGFASLSSDETYGTLDLGGASSQIAFFVPSQDVSEGLFKLQIGGQKHWNVYTKSFLQFGQNSARFRHVTNIADIAVENMDPTSAVVPSALDYCFFAGYSENVAPTHGETLVLISGPPVPAQDQFSRCIDALRPLLVKYNNDYCNVVYDGQCSINGAYQPSVTGPGQRPFIGTSSYRYPWKVLLLSDTASLTEYRKKAESVCSLSFRQALHYYEVNNFNVIDDKLGEMIPNYCFLVSYTYALLTEGYGFSSDQTLTVLDQVRGNKVSWPLGAIMYEINAMPWELDTSSETFHTWVKIILTAVIGIVFGALLTLFTINAYGLLKLNYKLSDWHQIPYHTIRDSDEALYDRLSHETGANNDFVGLRGKLYSEEKSSNGQLSINVDSNQGKMTMNHMMIHDPGDKYGSNNSTASTVVWAHEHREYNGSYQQTKTNNVPDIEARRSGKQQASKSSTDSRGTCTQS